MIRDNHSQKLAIVRKLQTFCVAGGQILVGVLRLRHCHEREAKAERIRASQRALCALRARIRPIRWSSRIQTQTSKLTGRRRAS
jgi:hypothetical protein